MEVGVGVSHAALTYEGYFLQHAILFFGPAGRDLVEYSVQAFTEYGHSMIAAVAHLALDDVGFYCEEIQKSSRGTYEQVVNDLAHLGSQLA